MERTGQCRCGAVRIRCTGEPRWVANCHCEDCRKATGSAFATYVCFPDDQLQLEGLPPRRYASSPGVERIFCATCGSPVAYRSHRWPGEWHLFVGFLDDAADLPPGVDAYLRDKLPWTHLDAYLRDKLPWTHLDPGLRAFDTVSGG